MSKENRSSFVISILLPLAIGSLSTLISGNRSMYDMINKPALSPPAFIFPVVWTILYILMGISAKRLHKKSPHRLARPHTSLSYMSAADFPSYLTLSPTFPLFSRLYSTIRFSICSTSSPFVNKNSMRSCNSPYSRISR